MIYKAIHRTYKNLRRREIVYPFLQVQEIHRAGLYSTAVLIGLKIPTRWHFEVEIKRREVVPVVRPGPRGRISQDKDNLRLRIDRVDPARDTWPGHIPRCRIARQLMRHDTGKPVLFIPVKTAFEIKVEEEKLFLWRHMNFFHLRKHICQGGCPRLRSTGNKKGCINQETSNRRKINVAYRGSETGRGTSQSGSGHFDDKDNA